MQATMQPPQYASYGPGLPPLATSVPTILSSVTTQHEVSCTARQRRTLTILSALQIAIGTSCAIIYISQISAAPKAHYIAFVDGVGSALWSGGVYIIAGSLGVVAVRQNRLCLMTSSMVFSVLSSVTLLVVIGYSVDALLVTVGDKRGKCSLCFDYDFNGYEAADSILIILSVTEFIVAVMYSVLCCKVSRRVCCLCCCISSDYRDPAQMVYLPVNSAGQHVVMIQQSGIAGGQALNALPSQPLCVDMQVPVYFAHPKPPFAAAAAAVPPSYQPGVAWLQEYPAGHMENASGGGDQGQRVEGTNDEVAYRY